MVGSNIYRSYQLHTRTNYTPLGTRMKRYYGILGEIFYIVIGLASLAVVCGLLYMLKLVIAAQR